MRVVRSGKWEKVVFPLMGSFIPLTGVVKAMKHYGLITYFVNSHI